MDTMSELPSSNKQASARARNVARPLGMASWMMAVLTLALIVAIIFAANSNQVVGWIVVIITGLWLLLVAGVFLTLRAGARAVGRRWDKTNANLAAKISNNASPDSTRPGVISEAEMNHEMKLDHSFKIVQVQHGVVMENLGKNDEQAKDMVNRALDTINITATNARDMIKQRRKDRHTSTVEGEIID